MRKQLKDELQELGAKNVEVIENGYDEEDFKINDSNSLDSKFTIAHIGSFSPTRNHHILWKVLEEIVIENNPQHLIYSYAFYFQQQF